MPEQARSSRPPEVRSTAISQRAERIWEKVLRRQDAQPPDNQHPDEPHADAERYRRLHVIVGDSNMSEYATFLKSALRA